MKAPYNRQHSDEDYAAGVRGIGQYLIDYPMSVDNVRVDTDSHTRTAKVSVEFIAPLDRYQASRSKQTAPQQLAGQPMLTGCDDDVIDGELC